jgi:3-dehydroquinate dehydratase-2
MKILILHGPNLNLLGEREPEVYGSMTLAQLNAKLKAHAAKRRCTLRIQQSNSEGALIDLLHKNRKWADAVVFNPGAYTHYSYALRDAVASICLPTIEVHLSDIQKREKFRRVSVIAPVCKAQISGHGWQSYTLAMEALIGGASSVKTRNDARKSPKAMTRTTAKKEKVS